MIWSGKRTAAFVKQPPEIKINPNGVDLKVSEVYEIHNQTVSVLNGKVRTTNPEKVSIKPDAEGFYNLEQGNVYEARLANEVSVPENAVGLMFPRSSLNRLGAVKSNTAIWEPGYKGFGTLTIFVPIKLFRIHKDEHWFQFTLQDCEKSDVLYDGHWQGEKAK